MASAPPTMFPGLNNKEINFEIKSNTGKMFYINLLNQEEYLIITAYYISNKNKIEYESKFDISYIKKVKLFILYDTINECLEEINSGINTGKSYLVEEKNYINIFIPLNNIKFNEINFKVDLKENINIVNNKEINELKNVIKEQNNDIINLKNKVNQLEILVNDLLIFKKDIVGKITFKINSKIVDSYFNIILIKNWINNINNESSKIIKAKLLYKLSKDGDSIDTFHQKCDNNSPTLLLVETTNGRKFGGYTTCVWSVNKGGKKDGKTFLFSLDEKKLYKKKKEHENERDIYCRKDAGPTFGGNDLYFYQTLKKGYSASPYYFLDKNDLAKNIKDDFDIKEIEIFKICFE
jgi:hypothetical protein